MGQPSPAEVTTYDPLDLVHLPATFLATDGVTPADPSVVDFLIRAPGTTVATYRYGDAAASVVRVGVGAYFKDVTAATTGTWAYGYVGTGGVQQHDSWVFLVSESFVL